MKALKFYPTVFPIFHLMLYFLRFFIVSDSSNR